IPAEPFRSVRSLLHLPQLPVDLTRWSLAAAASSPGAMFYKEVQTCQALNPSASERIARRQLQLLVSWRRNDLVLEPIAPPVLVIYNHTMLERRWNPCGVIVDRSMIKKQPKWLAT